MEHHEERVITLGNNNVQVRELAGRCALTSSGSHWYASWEACPLETTGTESKTTLRSSLSIDW
jgi:hypothetical protein